MVRIGKDRKPSCERTTKGKKYQKKTKRSYMDGTEEITRNNELGLPEFMKIAGNRRGCRRWVNSVNAVRHKG